MPDHQYASIEVSFPSKHPHVAVVTLNSPPLNALCSQDYEDLTSIFATLPDTRGVRCIVLTGAGSRCFSAGARLGVGVERTVQTSLDISAVIRPAFEAIRTCALPVVCAVNGAAVGAGLILASLGDIIVARAGAVFSLPEIDVGVMGGPRHAARILPDKVMRYMALTGRRVDSEYLCQIGAINLVVPAEGLMDTALEIANEIAGKSPVAARFMKEAINLGGAMDVQHAFRVEQLFNALAIDTPDAREIASARKEKRKPSFED